jgi:hypothetical protein
MSTHQSPGRTKIIRKIGVEHVFPNYGTRTTTAAVYWYTGIGRNNQRIKNKKQKFK